MPIAVAMYYEWMSCSLKPCYLTAEVNVISIVALKVELSSEIINMLPLKRRIYLDLHIPVLGFCIHFLFANAFNISMPLVDRIAANRSRLGRFILGVNVTLDQFL